ncbi:MAG: undecaprenyl-diphosphate phosphatase [Nocardioidaceae bacterium]|nr:MAG: undecaprenyl-diphosphate phosphatase [Nocardioidaceae bacterium]
MNYFEAIVLGVVEGLTEFLPISSTGHLMITEKILGLPISDETAQGRAVGAYTAVIQIGAIAAVLVYFAKDIYRIAGAWFAGLVRPERRGELDHRMGWYIIVGSVPIGLVGLAARDIITGPFKSLWVVAVALIAWSAVMLWAEKVGRQNRGNAQMTMRDAIFMGLMQCIALIPGVSRSGATISAGLFLGLDRVTATRLAFFLGIPSLTAAGLFELRQVEGIGAGPAIVGTLVAFVVAYASIAWLLRLVAHRSIGWFVPYRVGLGVVLLVLLGTGVMSAT